MATGSGQSHGLPRVFNFEAAVVSWRGPSPYFFAPIPEDLTDEVRWAVKLISYGWGIIPASATVRNILFKTSLFPKDGGYLLPLKADVRRRAGFTVGDRIVVSMTLEPRR